jgi:hypothetical protein
VVSAVFVPSLESFEIKRKAPTCHTVLEVVNVSVDFMG